MKLLIIDDEPLVRQGLKKLIPWKKHAIEVCGEAANGIQGLELILEIEPDIVLLDIRMPKIDGLETAKKAREGGYTGEFIILSGYTDFAYAKKAISLGVSDFLVKPVDEDELLAAVKKAVKDLENDRIMRAYKTDDIHELRQKVFGDLCEGKLKWNPSIGQITGITSDKGPHELVLVSGGNLTEKSTLARLNTASKLHHEIIATIDNCVITLIQGKQSIHKFHRELEQHHKHDQNSIFFLSGVIDDFSDEMISRLYSRVKSTLNRLFQLRVPGKFVYQYTASHGAEPPNANTAASSILDCMKSGGNVKTVVAALTSKLRESGLAKDEIIDILQEIYINVITYFDKEQKIKLSGTPLRLHHCDCLQEYSTSMEAEFNKLMAALFDRPPEDIATRICKIIEVEFHQPLKLKALADKLGYNPAYLGKVLKQATGLTFNEYLDKTRIAHAKVLLENNISITSVAKKCGYQSLDYFTSVYKKHEGCTPSAYRGKLH